MAQFKPSKSNLKAPTSGSSGGGLGTLLAYMIAQQKGQNLQQQLGENSTLVGGTDQSTGAKYQTPESISLRKYGKEDIQTIGASDSFSKSADYIIGELDKDPVKFEQSFKKANINIPGLTWGKQQRGNIFGFPTTYGDETSINIERALNDMSDMLLRLRSGAQINEQEYQRLRGLLPTYKDISVRFSEDGQTTFPTIRGSIAKFKDDLEASKQRAIQGGYYDQNAWDGPKSTSPIPGMPGHQNNQESDGSDEESVYNAWKNRGTV